MKPNCVLLFTTIVVLVLCVACGVWLHKERQQYARNRQLIAALTHDDAETALALINAGADPNTHCTPTPAPTLLQLLNQLLHHTLPPANDSPTAFMVTCGISWKPITGRPVMPVIMDEDLPLLKAMLAHGADVNAITPDNSTVLHYAVIRDRLPTAELLLQRGIDVDTQDELKRTPLMFATGQETVDATRMLLSHGANPNAQDADGSTSLSYAVESPNPENAALELLARGANPNLRSQSGVTPLQIAREMKRPDLVRLLNRGRK